MPDESSPYNPLDKKHLGESVAKELLARPLVALSALAPFTGAGIYTIHYNGPFHSYEEVVKRADPIYIGKAVPAGARKGLVGLDLPTGQVLFNRLREHADSIRAASNLDIEHFLCRFLVVEDIWIPLGESLLINRSQPIWNSTIAGFGNHDPGAGRYQQERSMWDTIHPGRSWAMRCRERDDAPQILERWTAQPRATP